MRRQVAQRLGIEEAHMLEFQQFNIVWDKKMQEYEEHAERLEEAMKVRCADPSVLCLLGLRVFVFSFLFFSFLLLSCVCLFVYLFILLYFT